MDMSKYAKQNDGVAFVLVVIDIFSKFLWMRPLEDKKGQSVTSAFENILRGDRRPTRIRTDKGQEFRARVFNAFLNTRHIENLYAQNTETKANYAERVIKTIKAISPINNLIVTWITLKISPPTIMQRITERLACLPIR
jgi:hypothetical protein